MKTWNEIKATNPVAINLRAMRKAAMSVASGGTPNGCILYGPGGWGKSMIINEAVRSTGLSPIERSNPSRFEAVRDALEAAGMKRPVVFDDPDMILRNERTITILKKATDPAVAPRERTYDHRIVYAPIFIATNEDLSNPKTWDAKLKTHGPALFTRFRPVGIPNDRIAQRDYTIALCLYQGLINNHRDHSFREMGKRPLRLRAEILEWFYRNAHNLESLSPRAMIGLAMAFQENDLTERELALRGFMKLESTKPMGCPIDFEAAIMNSHREAA